MAAIRRCEDVLQRYCVNGTCLPVVKECDGHRDCVDGSDEDNCTPPRPLCRPDELECGDVTVSCIFRGTVCDGVDNCVDGFDENFCSKCLSVCLSVCVRVG